MAVADQRAAYIGHKDFAVVQPEDASVALEVLFVMGQLRCQHRYPIATYAARVGLAESIAASVDSRTAAWGCSLSRQHFLLVPAWAACRRDRVDRELP